MLVLSTSEALYSSLEEQEMPTSRSRSIQKKNSSGGSLIYNKGDGTMAAVTSIMMMERRYVDKKMNIVCAFLCILWFIDISRYWGWRSMG